MLQLNDVCTFQTALPAADCTAWSNATLAAVLLRERMMVQADCVIYDVFLAAMCSMKGMVFRCRC